MTIKVEKWGNSLAVRLPRSVVQDTRLALGKAVDVDIQAGRILITPLRSRRVDLADLLKGVTRRNRHGETQTGLPVGQEAW